MISTLERGQQVSVHGFGGRTATLRVWEDRGRGATLCSEKGYWRLVAGDTDVALVGFPKQDIRSVVPTVPELPPEQSPSAAQD